MSELLNAVHDGGLGLAALAALGLIVLACAWVGERWRTR